MAPIQFANAAATTLNGGINNAVTSLTVTAATGFPTLGPFDILIYDDTGGSVSNAELIRVGGVSGTTFSSLTRAVEAYNGVQTAVSHSNGEKVALVLTTRSLLGAPNWHDVRAYGAKCDGTTDDTAAVQAAIDACAAGEVVHLVGTMLVDPITVDAGISLIGDGIGASVLKAKTGATGPILLVDLAVAAKVELREFTVDMVNEMTEPAIKMDTAGTFTLVDQVSVAGGSIGLEITSVGSATFSNLLLENQSNIAFLIDGDTCAENDYENINIYCGVSGMAAGIKINRTTATDVGGHTFHYCRQIRGGSGTIVNGFLATSTTANTFFGVWQNECVWDNVDQGSPVKFVNGGWARLVNCWLTGAGGYALYLDNAREIQVVGTWLDASGNGGAQFVNAGSMFTFTNVRLANGTMFNLPASDPPTGLWYSGIVCTTLANDTTRLATATSATVYQAPTAFTLLGTGGAQQSLALQEAGGSNAKYLRVTSNRLEVANSAFDATLLSLDNSGRLGLSVAPTAVLHVSGANTDEHGVVFAPALSFGVSNKAILSVQSNITPTAAIGTVFGMSFVPVLRGTNGVTTPTVTNLIGAFFQCATASDYDAAVANIFNLYSVNPSHAGAGAISTVYGYYCEEITVGTSKFAFYSVGATPSQFNGPVGLSGAPTSDALRVTGKVHTDTLRVGSSATAGHVLTADTSGNGTFQALPADPDKVIRNAHTFAVQGAIAVPAGQTDVIPGFYVSLASGEAKALVSCRHKIGAGTSATVKVQKNGSDITGWTGISVTTTATTTNPADETLADGDYIQIIVTAVSGSPENLSFSLFIEATQ